MSHDATARRTLLTTAALALLLATAACGGSDGDRLADELGESGGGGTVAEPVSGPAEPAQPAPDDSGTPSEPAKPAPAEPAPAKPAPAKPAPAQPAAPSGLPDGRFEVHVVAAEDGSLVLDRGRFVQSEPVEPGVDSTAPITFDTGAVAERQRTAVASDARLVMQVAGVGTTQVSFADVAAATGGRQLLATVTVSGHQVTVLEQLYRA